MLGPRKPAAHTPSVEDMNLPTLAGVVSTVIFALSTMPMLVKAARTKDLASYSLGNILLANTGNLVHSVYVFSLPAGPIWALHTFYLVSTGMMLVWYLRYARTAGTRGYWLSSAGTSATLSTRWTYRSMSRPRASASSSGQTGSVSVQYLRPTSTIGATLERSA